MKNELYITGFVRIKNSEVFLNGQRLFSAEQNMDLPEFLKAVYRHFGIKYPKFFKMDNLCKLAFLSAEILLKDFPLLENHKSEHIAVVLSNSTSSLNTDLEHFRTITDSDNFFPSPAVFVYTLPNITIGEICIRHKINGENNFFCSEKFNSDTLIIEAKRIFGEGKATALICGWTEVGLNGNEADSILFLLENDINLNNNNFLNFEKDNLNKIYNKTE